MGITRQRSQLAAEKPIRARGPTPTTLTLPRKCSRPAPLASCRSWRSMGGRSATNRTRFPAHPRPLLGRCARAAVTDADLPRGPQVARGTRRRFANMPTGGPGRLPGKGSEALRLRRLLGAACGQASTVPLAPDTALDPLRTSDEVEVFEVFYSSIEHLRIAALYCRPARRKGRTPAIMFLPGYQMDPPILKDWGAPRLQRVSCRPARQAPQSQPLPTPAIRTWSLTTPWIGTPTETGASTLTPAARWTFC